MEWLNNVDIKMPLKATTAKFRSVGAKGSGRFALHVKEEYDPIFGRNAKHQVLKSARLRLIGKRMTKRDIQ